MTAVAHPAKWSKALRPYVEGWLRDAPLVLDPMAGVAAINVPNLICGEIEPEWAVQCSYPTYVGDAGALPFADATFPAAVTSPTFANRKADNHDARDRCKRCGGGTSPSCPNCRGSSLSKRKTYRHTLGRELHPQSTASLQWGPSYRQAHRERIYPEILRVLRPGGFFVVNISDHVRKGVVEEVAPWTVGVLVVLSFTLHEYREVPTPRDREGANGEVRVGHEVLAVFRKPPA